jgi:hypothetical protein
MTALRITLALLALWIIAAMISCSPSPHGCATIGHVIVIGCR